MASSLELSADPTAVPPGSRNPALIQILVTVFLTSLTIGVIIPVAPHLVEELLGGAAGTAGPSVHGAGDSRAAFTYGWLAAIYSIMLFISAPILGSLSDQVGRRPVILISLLGSAIDLFAQALSPTLAWLLFTRALNGVSGGEISVCNAYIADVTPPAKRGAAYGMFGAAFGLGFIFGPGVGGFLGEYNIRAPFYLAGTLCLINWLYGFFVLKESLEPANRRSFSIRKANPVGTFGKLAHNRLVLGLASFIFLFNLAQYMLHVTWVLYTAHRYQWSEGQVGLSLVIVGVGAAAVQGGLTRPLIKRFGEARCLVAGAAIGCLAYAGYGLATEGWMVYAIVGVASLGGVAGPACQSLITRHVRPDEQGETQGALAGLNGIATIIGMLAGSSLFGYFISDKAPFILPGAPFFASASLAAIGTTIAFFTLRVEHIQFKANAAVAPAPLADTPE